MTQYSRDKKASKSGKVIPVIALAVLLIASQIPQTRAALLWAISPIAKSFQGAGVWLRARREAKKSFAVMRGERDRALDLVAQLAIDMAKLDALKKENEQLLALSGYSSSVKTRVLTAQFLGYDTQGTRRRALLDKGVSDGVLVGDAVLAGKGILIGSIESTTSGSSVVRLLRDEQARIAASVAGVPESNGILMPIEGGALALRFLSENAKIKKGDVIVTTGQNAHVPSGLVVGVVELIAKESDAPFLRAVLTTLVPVDTLRFAGIML